MTIELTHKQAFALRCIKTLYCEDETELPESFCVETLFQMELITWSEDEDGDPLELMLTTSGNAALATYDAKWIPVERERLQEVANYISECAPPSGASADEVGDYHVVAAHCQFMLTGIGPYGEPTDGEAVEIAQCPVEDGNDGTKHLGTDRAQLQIKSLAEHQGQAFYSLETGVGSVQIRVTKAGKIFAVVGEEHVRIL